MTTADLLQETSAALLANKARSGLTVLGIVIGIASVIALLAVGRGATASIQSNIQSLGANLLIVSPGAARSFGGPSGGRGTSQTLTNADADAVAALSGVAAVAPELSSRSQIVARGGNTNASVIGTVPAYADVRNLALEEGSFITQQNQASGAKVAVLGSNVRDDLFGTSTSAVGQTVHIDGGVYAVIGIAAPKGTGGFGSSDDAVFVPLLAAQRYLVGGQYLSTLSVQAASADVMTSVQQNISDLLLARHRVSTADFTVTNQSDITSAASSVTSTLTSLLAAVASISLLVGGIGIMNMMLTTVTERTREIGLRKAVGAKRREISRQFLLEAVLLTGVGGVAGIALGWCIAFVLSYLGVISAEVSASAVLLAVGVSAVIGVAFGYYPARRAAGLSPIEALRFE